MNIIINCQHCGKVTRAEDVRIAKNIDDEEDDLLVCKDCYEVAEPSFIRVPLRGSETQSDEVPDTPRLKRGYDDNERPAP